MADAMVALNVNGKNISLQSRSFASGNDVSVRQNNSRFSAQKKYYCSSPPEQRRSKYNKKRPTSKDSAKKKTLSRVAYNLPVKCLPGGVFREQSTSTVGNEKREDCRRRRCGCCRHVWPQPSKTLIEISEADQVSDFKRILGSNAILSGTARSLASLTEMYSDAPLNDARKQRPLSSYSVWNVNETYNYLFQRHLDSLQTVLNRQQQIKSPNSLTVDDDRLYEDLYNLSEYYDDDDDDDVEECSAASEDDAEEDDEVAATTADTDEPPVHCANNFNVNLSDLLLLENRCSWDSADEDQLIMSTSPTVDEQDLEKSLRQLRLNKDELPTITLTECITPSQSPLPRHIDSTTLNLNVPSVDCDVVESRPPLAD